MSDEQTQGQPTGEVEPHSLRHGRSDEESSTPDALQAEHKAEQERDADEPEVEPHSFRGF
jgi:hypothetical protein